MTALRGIVRSFDGTAYQATIQLVGSRQTSLTVPVSKAIPQAEMVAGRQCALLEFWPNDPLASVVVAVWP